jgi:hypothetical protein
MIASAANTIRTWRIRRETKGCVVSREDVTDHIRELWPVFADDVVEEIAMTSEGIRVER